VTYTLTLIASTLKKEKKERKGENGPRLVLRGEKRVACFLLPIPIFVRGLERKKKKERSVPNNNGTLKKREEEERKRSPVHYPCRGKKEKKKRPGVAVQEGKGKRGRCRCYYRVG